MDFQVDRFLDDLNTLARRIDSRNGDTNLEDLDSLQTETDSTLTTLLYLQSVLLVDADRETTLQVNNLIEEFRTSLRILRSDILQRRAHRTGPFVAVPSVSGTSSSSGRRSRGRPKANIDEETLLSSEKY